MVLPSQMLIGREAPIPTTLTEPLHITALTLTFPVHLFRYLNNVRGGTNFRSTAPARIFSYEHGLGVNPDVRYPSRMLIFSSGLRSVLTSAAGFSSRSSGEKSQQGRVSFPLELGVAPWTTYNSCHCCDRGPYPGHIGHFCLARRAGQ